MISIANDPGLSKLLSIKTNEILKVALYLTFIETQG